MKVVASWDDENKTILCLTFYQGWTWEDLNEGQRQAVVLSEGIEYQVDMILDARNSVGVPPGFLSYTPILLRTVPSILNRIVVVGASPVMTGLFSILNTLYRSLGKRFSFVQTMEEAREMLQKE